MIAVAVIVLTCAIEALVSDPDHKLVTGQLIATSVGYPGVLKVESIVPASSSLQSTRILWSLRIYSDNKDFAATEVSLLEGGAYLTTEQKQVYERLGNESARQKEGMRRLAEQFPQLQGPLEVIRLLDLEGGRNGYLLALPGMSGVGLEAVMASPDTRYDLVIRTSIAQGLTTSTAAADYQKRLREDPLMVIGAMAQAVERVLFRPGKGRP